MRGGITDGAAAHCPAAPGTDSRSGTPRKVALTDLAAFMVTIQIVPETVSHPLQPKKIEIPVGVAVRVTTVLES